MAILSVSLLGSLQISLGGQVVNGFKSDKVRALLIYLVVEAARSHRRETLAALLWPEVRDQAARSNLRDALSNLRQVIGDRMAKPPFLFVERNTIQFRASSDHWVDVAAFRMLVSVDRGEQPSCQQMEEAIALYRGAFLEGFSLKDSSAFDDWSLLTRERLQRQALLTLYKLTAYYEKRGEYMQACDYARRQIELEPWEEEGHRQLMRILTLSGQRGTALAQYESCKQLLAGELGVEPAEETTRLVEQIRDGRLVGPVDISTAAATPGRELRLVGDCPYRGLAAFREKDAVFFFGREGFALRLLQTVQKYPGVTIVVGSSGSGKSSVITAGLLPHLRNEGNWLIASFRPGADPFGALAGALLPLLEQELTETNKLLESRNLAHSIYRGDLKLHQVVERIMEKEGGEKRLLLVADQFEELYTLCPDQDTRRRFLHNLLLAAESERKIPGSPLVALISLRADFMGQALSYRPFADALQELSLMLGPMRHDELRAAIEMPAQKQGAAFETGLVNRILDDVGEEPGNLPLLEFALLLLWEQADSGWLTHAAYEMIGRVGGSLARHADQVYRELDEKEQQGAQKIFVQLVRPGEGTEDTRRVATRSELGDKNWRLVQYLADKRLVVTGQDANGKEIVEVVHEALIQRWGRLREWIDADRTFRTWQEALRAALHQWKLIDNDEGALLRGAPLAQAENWLAERGSELSLAEIEFIQASTALQEARRIKRERRRRWTILALTGGLVVAIMVAIFAFNASTTAQREADVNHSLVVAANAQQAQDNGEVDLALALALEAVDIIQPPSEAVRTLSTIAMGPGTRAILTGHSNAITDVTFSPDGRTFLSSSCGKFDSERACVQGEMILWDAEAGTELRRFEGHTGWVNSIAFSPDSQTALSGSGDATLILWGVETGEVVRNFEGHAAGVNSVAFRPDGDTAISGSDDATIILWDVNTGKAIRRFEGHTGGVNNVAFSPDGQTALSGSDDTTLILWDITTGDEIRRFVGHINEITGLVFNLDERTMLSTGDHTLRLWDLETREEIRQQHFGGMPELFAISTDGRTLIFELGGLRLWDIERWREYQWLLGGDYSDVWSEFAESAALSPNGLLALSGSSDGSLRLWNLGGYVVSRHFETDGTPLSAVAVSPDGRRLLTGDMADHTKLWDVERGEVIQHFDGNAIAVSPNSVAFSPDGKQALVGSGDAFGGSGARSLVLWDLETGAEIRRLEGHRFVLRSVAISPDGSTALTGSQRLDDSPKNTSDQGELILWDLGAGEQIRRFDNTEDITSIAFSADGSRALTGSAYFSNLILWDVVSGKEIRRFEEHTNMVLDVAFGPNDITALSASADGSLILWDVETGDVIRRFLGHDDMVWSLDVSPEGNFMLSGSGDHTLILWDFETGETLRRFREHSELVPGVVFGPDNHTAYSVSLDGELIEWQVSDLPLDELIDWIYANRYVRNLTCGERVQYNIKPNCD